MRRVFATMPGSVLNVFAGMRKLLDADRKAPDCAFYVWTPVVEGAGFRDRIMVLRGAEEGEAVLITSGNERLIIVRSWRYFSEHLGEETRQGVFFL